MKFDVPANGVATKGQLIILEADGEGRVEFPLEDLKSADMPDWR
ncbi:hypothetical protein P12x_002885 [Tundrisphaera lichenicola]